MPRIALSQLELEYLEVGPTDGPLALCLHGFPDHARTFHGLAPHLAEAGYHVVAPWLRGYAPSDLSPDGNYQLGALATDAIELLERLAPGRSDSVLIGHDWGALIAHAAAGARPDLLSHLITMAVPHQASLMDSFLNDPDQLQRSWYIFVFQTLLAETAVAANNYAFIHKLWREWSPMTEPAADHLAELIAGFSEEGRLTAALSYYRYMLGTLPGDPAYAAIEGAGFGPINVPTLYLHGALDACMSVNLVQESMLEDFFPSGIEVARIADAGHFLHLDAPAVVHERITQFLTR